MRLPRGGGAFLPFPRASHTAARRERAASSPARRWRASRRRRSSTSRSSSTTHTSLASYRLLYTGKAALKKHPYVTVAFPVLLVVAGAFIIAFAHRPEPLFVVHIVFGVYVGWRSFALSASLRRQANLRARVDEPEDFYERARALGLCDP